MTEYDPVGPIPYPETVDEALDEPEETEPKHYQVDVRFGWSMDVDSEEEAKSYAIDMTEEYISSFGHEALMQHVEIVEDDPLYRVRKAMEDLGDKAKLGVDGEGQLVLMTGIKVKQ